MKLHFRGIQVPALGSPRDVVYRDFLLYEAKLEAKKHQMLLLLTIGAPSIEGESSRSQWNSQAKNVFDEYISLMFGEETTSKRKEEAEMLKYYMEKIKNSAPVIAGSSTNQGNGLSVSNLPEF